MIEGSPEYRRHVAHQIGAVCRWDNNIPRLMAHSLAVFPTPIAPLCLQILHQKSQLGDNSLVIDLFPGRTVVTRAEIVIVRTLVYPTTIGGLS